MVWEGGRGDKNLQSEGRAPHYRYSTFTSAATGVALTATFLKSRSLKLTYTLEELTALRSISSPIVPLSATAKYWRCTASKAVLSSELGSPSVPSALRV